MRTGVVAAAVLFVAACAPVPPHRQPPFAEGLRAGEATVAACTGLIAAFDDAVIEAQRSDGGPRGVAGYPFFRADRTVATLARSDAPPVPALLSEMRRLDRAGRAAEAANLPPPVRARLWRSWSGRTEGATLEAALEGCGDRLARSAGTPALARISVPDDYSAAKRIAGIYALARIPFASGVRGYQAQTERTFALPAEQLPVTGQLRRYAVAEATVQTRAPSVLDYGSNAAFGDLLPWFMQFAPVFEVDTSGEDDRIGTPVFDSQGRPALDTARPALFVRLSHARVGTALWPQLVYTAWFPARPRQGWLDLLGGRLDGLVWRVTLGPDGTPWLFDTMHPCGCYHQFFPTARLVAKPRPDSLDEWAFVPQSLPALAASERVTLRVAAGTHYLQRVILGERAPAEISLALVDDEALRVLPDPRGGTRSLFGPDGIVRGTERGERWWFWPMGIAEPGAMRQWGRHATAFIGRRHFDDPDLLTRYFELATP